MTTPDLGEVTALDLLAQKFPGWRIWRNDAGHWYATRPPLNAAERQARCARTVEGETPAALDQQITAQPALTQAAS